MSQSDKLGKYEVIRQIAVGAMAELYLARTVGMEGFEKLVCVKRILPQYTDNPRFVEMFLDEARLAATLQHPNIAQVYDIGQDHGEFFFAMEYVHGVDLGRLMATARENGVPISLDCALTLASGLCAGLHHAHEKASPEGKPLGVVHRDVSPGNVLVSYDGAVKVVDFGIARAGGEPLASGNGLKGKIAYMSPEQCRGKVALDRRSDVFSVGTILYELTTGRPPFVDATEYGVLQQIVNRDADPPSALVPGYPPPLEAIVMRALSRDVARRFSTALELQNQLEDFAHDNRLRVSPLVLARLMSTLFPARLEEWDHARAQGAFFVEQHVVRTLMESGKVVDGGPTYVPQPLPPAADEFSGAAAGSAAPAVAASRGSQPGIEQAAATQVGPPPVAPRMATPAPGELGRAAPQTAPGQQPRLPTPPPVPGAQPLPGVRYAAMPVPNMPGAVPILPMMAPSGGTLVSSALQAGTAAGVSTMAPGTAMPASPIPGTPPPGYVPAAAGDFGAVETGRGSPPPGGYASFAGSGMPEGTAAAAAMPSPGQRAAAHPTLVMRVNRRRWLPIAMVIVMGGIGAVAIAVVMTGADAHRADRDGAAVTAPTGAAVSAKPEPAAGAKPDPSGGAASTAAAGAASAAPAGEASGGAAEAAKAAATDPAKTGAATDPGGAGGGATTAGAAAAAPSPSGAAASAPAATGSVASDGAAVGAVSGGAAGDATPGAAATGAATSGAAAQRATTATAVPGSPSALLPAAASDAKADTARKRSAKVASPDPRKPARRVRPEAKRGDAKRASKSDVKEQTWNDDSPFMPVPSPKR